MKKWPVIIFVVALVFYSNTADQKKSKIINQSKKLIVHQRNMRSGPTPLLYGQIPSRPPLVKNKRVPASYVKDDPPLRKINVTLSDNPIRIGKNFQVVEGVSTLEKNKYQPRLGKKLDENGNFVFFQSANPSTEAWPVAFDAVNLKLHPISHILHVKGVDSDLREQFKSEGLQEHYYHSRLKYIFLETTPSTVIQQFQKLTARGFEVRLEVIRDGPHPN